MFALLLLVLLPATSPAARLACYEQTRDKTTLGQENALRLCADARDAGPLSCFEQARQQTSLGQEQSIELCRCAKSTQPVACFEHARQQTQLDDYQIIQVCRPRLVDPWAPHCAP